MTRLDNTGKRGEVRINSGLPVDHSGPELRVGPTTPETADRKSEACPPDSVSISQRKSGRESESGALSASEARVALRSEAQLRGVSSLVLNQINRYTNAHNELQKRGRKRRCGSRTLRGRSLDGLTEKLIRQDCKTWSCSYCGPRKRVCISLFARSRSVIDRHPGIKAQAAPEINT